MHKLICLFAILAVFLPLHAQEEDAADIEYDSFTIELKDGRLLTPRNFTKAVLETFNVKLAEGVNLSSEGIPVTGLKGYIALRTISMALGDSASASVADGRLVIRYKREDAEKIKTQISNTAGKLIVRLFGGEVKPNLIADFDRYGIHSVGKQVEGRECLLMIHGLDSSAEDFNQLAEFLSAKEKWNLYVFEYKNDQPIAKSALELSFSIGDIPDKRISVLTKSMGALVIREYVTNKDLYKNNIQDILMVVPPNHGSNLARLRFVLDLGEGFTLINEKDSTFREALAELIKDGMGEAGDDLTPGSLFLDRLNSRNMPKDIRYAVIAGRFALVTEDQHKKLAEWISEKEKTVSSPYAKMVFGKIKHDFLECLEIIHNKGDMAVTLESARLDGAVFFKEVDRNHLNVLSGGAENPVYSEVEKFFSGKTDKHNKETK